MNPHPYPAPFKRGRARKSTPRSPAHAAFLALPLRQGGAAHFCSTVQWTVSVPLPPPTEGAPHVEQPAPPALLPFECKKIRLVSKSDFLMLQHHFMLSILISHSYCVATLTLLASVVPVIVGVPTSSDTNNDVSILQLFRQKSLALPL